MLNNYAETGGGFNSNHGQTSRPTDSQKQQNIGSTWSYNSQLEGMYYGSEHQPMFVGPYEGSTKHSNYSQYPSGTIHQPVPTPMVKCHEACCQHFQDRYPLNPAPLRYQPSGPVQPRYADLSGSDSRQYFTDRRSIQPSLSRKKYPADNGYPGIPERHFSQYMGRGQLHMADSRQQMQMMRSQYPMYPPYWGSARGWTGPRMNCPPPPPYHQSVNQGAQLQAGLKMTDGTHYMDPSTQKPITAQHRRGVGTGSGGTDIIRPVPEPKRTSLDPNLQSCYEFGYPTGFVPFSEVNKIQGGSIASQSNNSTCKISSDKQYHPHQMQYSMQNNDRNMMNCNNAINDLSYSMNFPLPNDSYMRPVLEDAQQISDARKLSLQYDSSLSKKRPDLDLRQYLATWEDDEDESTRLSEPLTLGNSGAPYIVVDCRSLEGEAATKLQERFKATSQNCSSKPRNSSPNSEHKRTDEQPRQDENCERAGLHTEFQPQTSYAPSMPTLLSDSDKNMNFWNGTTREGEGVIGKGGAFQPLDCSKRDGNLDPNAVSKQDTHSHSDLSVHKIPGTNESSNMSFDALVNYYGDNRRMVDGGYDFVEMTERLVNNSEKTSTNNHQLSTEISRPCDPRLQQSQLGNNPSIYNKITPRYPTNNYQHFKTGMSADPYFNYKHPMGTSKYFGYDNSQVVDPNYDYHKIATEFDSARLYGNKEVSKDPRRMFHQEIDKTVESTFLDPMRKAQLTDCFQTKTNLEFNAVDTEQFISPIIIKKSDLESRDKPLPEKNSAIRERMDVINSENQTHSEKTVLITSQNGPPEIFRVPYSPEKELSHKDNVVTLHSGDQSKTNTITVEVPYVQQYSTLVKLSEEISRTEISDDKIRNKPTDSGSPNKTSNEEFKKPTSFKLKRLPNSKEWTVEGKECNESNKIAGSENNAVNVESSPSCELAAEEKDLLKSSVAVSNLNMPSLDDIRDGEENCESIEENHSKNKLNDGVVCSNEIGPTCDEVSKNKYDAQPQMAIVEPLKLNQSETKPLESNVSNKFPSDDDEDKDMQKSQSSINSQNSNETSFDSEKAVKPSSYSLMELNSESDISKHENFRTHKKIQSSFSSTLPNCLSSPNEDFLHSQDGSSGGSKGPYSPFHEYSDCDMNAQITDYFKIDERTVASEKILDTRIPSSPGVDGMFEDINHSDQNELFQSKTCHFQDLTDPNMSSLSHNAHFQSFSSIFSEDAEKRERPDGSVLQMSDKKCLNSVYDHIENHQISNSFEERINSLESNSQLLQDKSDDSKKSPPIPTISLKLNESKKIWCIAKKDQLSDQSTSPKNMSIIDSVLKPSTITHETCSIDVMSKLGTDLPRATNGETRNFSSENCYTNETPAIMMNLNETEHKDCEETQSESVLDQLMYSEVNKNNPTSTMENVFLTHDINEKSSTSVGNIIFSKSDLKHLQRDHLFQPQTTNNCQSVVKYYPKMKIFNRICSSNNTQNVSPEPLIFDEKGIHYPKSRSDKTKTSESKSIAQDVLHYIISKAVSYNCNAERNNLSHIVSSFDNCQNQYNEHETNANGDYSFNALMNTQTVIKFDSSSSHHVREIKEQGNYIIKSTEMFIQHEKENGEHYSVIKAINSEPENYICSVYKKLKTIRSIFSPRSDDGKGEDTLDPNSKNNMHKVIIQEKCFLHVDAQKPSLNKDQSDYLDLEDIDNIQENQALNCNSSKEKITCTNEDVFFEGSVAELNTSAQELIANNTTTNNIDDEDFRGFGSPKISSRNEESECNIRDNFEIDDALELMGLSNVESLETANEKIENIEGSNNISLTEFIAEKSSESLQQSLENETEFDIYLVEKNDNNQLSSSNDRNSYQMESKTCSINNFNELQEMKETENIGCVHEHKHFNENKESDFTVCTHGYSTSDTLSNTCDRKENDSSAGTERQINNSQNYCSSAYEVHIEEPCQPHVTKTDSLKGKGPSDFSNDSTLSQENGSSNISSKEKDSEIKDAFKNATNCSIDHQIDPLPPLPFQQTHNEEDSVELSATESSRAALIKSTSTGNVDGSSCIVSCSSLQDSVNSKVKLYSEDFEARLETSVIVRNNTCNNIRCNQFDESYTDVSEEPVLFKSKQISVSEESCESICNSSYINNESAIQIRLKKPTEIDLDLPYLESQNTTGEKVESCSNSSLTEENTTLHENHDKEVDHFRVDFDIKMSTKRAGGCSNEISDAKICFATHNHEVGAGNMMETQSPDVTQASVTSEGLKSAGTEVVCEMIDNVEETEKLYYCVGESVFLCFEETEMYLKNSKLSYFHDFKKRKWQKFSKFFSDKTISFNENVHVLRKTNERDYTIINFSLNNCRDVESSSTNYINNICTSQYESGLPVPADIELKATNSSSRLLEMESEAKDNSHVHYTNCIVKDKFYSTNLSGTNETNDARICLTNNNLEVKAENIMATQSSKVLCSTNVLLENIGQVAEDCLNNSVIVEKDHCISAPINDFPIPLKDKSQFFTSKETNLFCIRRDSLKILEPEAVLKEIFSPDPECGDSESKENECPAHFSQDTHDSSLQQLEVKRLMSNTNHASSNNNIAFSSVPNMPSKQSKWPDYALNNHDSDLNCKATVQPHDSNVNASPLQDKTVVSPSADYDIKVCSISSADQGITIPCQSFGVNCTSIQNTELYKGSVSSYTDSDDNDSSIQTLCLDKSTVVSCQDPIVNDSPVETKYPTTMSSYHNSVQNDGLVQSADFDKTIVSFPDTDVLDREIQMTEKGIKQCKSQDSGISDSSAKNADNDEAVVTYHQDYDDTVSSVDITQSEKPTVSSSLDSDITECSIQKIHQEEETIPANRDCDFNDCSIQTTDQVNTTLPVFQDSASNSSVQTTDHEVTTEAVNLLLVTNNDSLLSAEHFEDEDCEATKSDLHSKDDSRKSFVEKRQENIVDCQNIKINSVQDSLRNSQHLNKDTFPLQCLVEAALALENVDCKQIMQNNSSFSGRYSQSNDSFIKSPESEGLLNDNLECSVKIKCLTNSSSKADTEKNNGLTPADREIFSKFEETNYNLRASTRIVTSSSSNIIPYPKRKYSLKSSKISSTASENKQKKTEAAVTEKSRTKKRRGCFTYPRSKRRKKINKDKQKCQKDYIEEPIEKNTISDINFEVLKNNIEKEPVVDENQSADSKYVQSTPYIKNCSTLNFDSQSGEEDNCKTNFGGPLLIASENTSTEGNIFCVHVNSDKMDEYVNNLNLGELEILSDTNQNVFKESSSENNSSNVPNVTLENGTSLVIIIEELEDETSKKHYDNSKGESDIILGSFEGDCSASFVPQSNSILNDCSDILTAGYSSNESCICPPKFEINGNSENKLLKEKTGDMLENEHLISRATCETSDNVGDSYRKYPVNCTEELLTTNCYEEINDNLINDIGNWPFVEEEVAEFNSKSELPNKIPEEGRKIELKCSLPWKKIFNMCKNKKKKNKTSRKISGLELGPAKVEVRLRAPSAEWKVISDYHEISSPVVKVSRLILQRDSDGSSYSEKDSEEEHENKIRSSPSSINTEAEDKTSNNDHTFGKSISHDENWQPVVLLTRIKDIDELTTSLDPKLRSQIPLSTCSSQFSCSAEEKDGDNTADSHTESEASEIMNDNDQLDSFNCSLSSESSSSQQSESKSVLNPPEDVIEYKSYQREKTNKVHGYETYSPSGCNNQLASETAYSPSDPHFSPETGYRNSDSGSFCENTRDGNTSSGSDDDVFLDNDDLSESTNLEAIDMQRKDELVEERTEENSSCQLEKEKNIIDACDTMRDIVTTCQGNDVSDAYSPTSSFDLTGFSVVENETDSSSHKDPQGDSDRNSEATKIFTCSKDLLKIPSVVDNERKSTDPSQRIIYEQKKKSRRKMPRNFFVRKKFRKNKGDFDNIDDKALFEKESDVQKSENTVLPEPSCESLEKPSAVSVRSTVSSPLESSQSESQSGKCSSANDEHVNSSESDVSIVCENSRLQCVYDLEDSSPVRRNESPLVERFEVKQRLRNGGRGLKRPCEGHSKEDTKRRRKKFRSHCNRCLECEIQFKNEDELSRHNAYRHARRRELHHCLLCQRTFSSAVRHSLHVQGRSHCHLELTQRHTMHAMHRLLVGGEFPLIPQLSRAELRALEWRPAQPGYTHIYHELTPLQMALQERNSDVSEDTLSEVRTPND